MEQKARQLERWLAVVSERAAHGHTVAAHDVMRGVLPWRHAPLKLPHAPNVLLELGLGLRIGGGDRLGDFL